MAVDEQVVRRVAGLARIALPESEVASLAGELNEILGFVEQLGEVDTDGVEAMAAVVAKPMPWRADRVTDGGIQADVLGNAPAAAHGYFAVPKVIE